LIPGHFAAHFVSDICAWASRPIAAACFERLRGLIAQGFFVEGELPTTPAYLATAERFARGDHAGAAEAYRPLLNSRLAPAFAAIAFDRAGDPETASRIDAVPMSRAVAMHGATMAHVREARRAFARKDFTRARELARTVVHAWEVADVSLKPVAEMRALLARLPK
jgi:hypothetical protein